MGKACSTYPPLSYSPQITCWSSQGMRVLRQCTVPRAEAMFVTIQRKTFAPQRMKWTRLLQCLNCPMYGVRLWVTTSLYRCCYYWRLRGCMAHGAPYPATITDLWCFHMWVLIIPDSSAQLSSSNQQTPSSEAGRNLVRMSLNLVYKYFFSYCRDLKHTVATYDMGNLRHGITGFTSPPKEDVPRIFSPFKTPSSSSGLEPANIAFSWKHANH
jgi:hypothetical protein